MKRLSKKALFGKLAGIVIPVVAGAIILVMVIGPEALFQHVVDIGNSALFTKLPDEQLETLENVEQTLQTNDLLRSYVSLYNVIRAKELDTTYPCKKTFITRIPKNMKKGEHILLEQVTDDNGTKDIYMYIVNDRGVRIEEKVIKNRVLCAIAGGEGSDDYPAKIFYDFIMKPANQESSAVKLIGAEEPVLWTEAEETLGTEITSPNQIDTLVIYDPLKGKTYINLMSIKITDGSPDILMKQDEDTEWQKADFRANMLLYVVDETHRCFIPTKSGATWYLLGMDGNFCDGKDGILDNDCIIDPDEHGLATENSWLKECRLSVSSTTTTTSTTSTTIA